MTTDHHETRTAQVDYTVQNEMISRPPSLLNVGDVINDEAGQRAVEISELNPIVINYCGGMVPVWYVRGLDTRTDLNGSRKVKLLIVPRTRVQVITRRSQVPVSSY